MQRPRDPFTPAAFRAAFGAALLVLVAAGVAALIRVLPWALDPTISWSTLTPFARSLLSLAVEAALLTGWPIGWALATNRLVERGESRLLASLGEGPRQTLFRLLPQGAVLVLILGLSSLVLGRDASAPGKVVRGLLEEGRTACLRHQQKVGALAGRKSVPMVAATWLCFPLPDAPRLVGRTPVGNAIFSAARTDVSDDLRRVDLVDANVAVLGTPSLRIHVGALTLRGLPPWARASAIPPALRAVVVALSGLLAASASVLALLRLRRENLGSLRALAIGASGPLAALAALRALDLRVPEVPSLAWLAALVLVPIAAVSAVATTSALAVLLPLTQRSARN
jgi:hypothetical protein